MSSASADTSVLNDTSTFKHAAIGAVITLVTFFLPFSPVIGGGVAGYLHGPDGRDGAIVGGLAGLLAAVPGAVLATLVASVFIIAGPGARSGILVALVFFLLILLVSTLYGGVLGALGGFAGAVLNREFDGPTETDPDRLHDPTTLRDDSPEVDDGLDSDDHPDSDADGGPRSESTEFDADGSSRE
ncbi:DUF5518 domain-containing protein [Halobaculum sp. CBA1158]|uniref:DUF5518 domain-containing protein n=1 Tax=Halobaculum sp. CBA1158 TaxID=2904243 RepID=UPI001F3EFAC9|nr:DUF5518 domain-containing protein [Halobaculum sp. CBA1158]UIO99948.1 DUF5518 domain-containing protein [Halobaculum sp. CBA1158]